MQKSWEKLPLTKRAQYLKEISSKIRQNTDFLAEVITKEQGKILSLAKIEVIFTADYIDYISEWARRYEGGIIQSDIGQMRVFFYLNKQLK